MRQGLLGPALQPGLGEPAPASQGPSPQVAVGALASEKARQGGGYGRSVEEMEGPPLRTLDSTRRMPSASAPGLLFKRI